MSASGDRDAAPSDYFVGPDRFKRGPAGGFYSVDDIRLANRYSGQLFFESTTMRFFGSRIGETVYGGRFFVSSEADRGPGVRAWDGQRRYSVRFARCDGSIETLLSFGAYSDGGRANRAAARAAHLWTVRIKGGGA